MLLLQRCICAFNAFLTFDLLTGLVLQSAFCTVYQTLFAILYPHTASFPHCTRFLALLPNTFLAIHLLPPPSPAHTHKHIQKHAHSLTHTQAEPAIVACILRLCIRYVKELESVSVEGDQAGLTAAQLQCFAATLKVLRTLRLSIFLCVLPTHCLMFCISSLSYHTHTHTLSHTRTSCHTHDVSSTLPFNPLHPPPLSPICIAITLCRS